MTREENGIRASAFIATSLDGFIARRNGELDWLHSAGAASGDEDHGYGAFMRTVDVIVMGRHTFEKVRSFDKWPYEKPAVVLASRPLVPNELRGAVRHMSGSPPQILAKLFAEGLRQAYVDGGKTVPAGRVHSAPDPHPDPRSHRTRNPIVRTRSPRHPATAHPDPSVPGRYRPERVHRSRPGGNGALTGKT